jgi:hypothetical protein
MQLLPCTHGEAQSVRPQDTVARIAPHYAVNFAELQNYVLDHYYNLLYRNNSAAGYQRGLDELVANKLKMIDFFNLRLYENKELLQSIRRTIAEESVIQYYRAQFLAKYVNEQSLREAYGELGRELAYRQILLPVERASRASRDSLKRVARAIRAKLERGAGFAELAREYTPNGHLSHAADSLRLVTWKMSLLDSDSRGLFRLPVGDVRILESPQSIRVVKIAGITYKAVPPFDAVRDDIERTLERSSSDEAIQEFENAKNALVDEHAVRWNQQALDQLVAWSNIPGFYVNGYKDTLQKAISRGRNLRILTSPAGPVDYKEYLRLLNDVLLMGQSNSYTEKGIKRFILEAMRTDALVKKADTLHLEQEIFNPTTNNAVLAGEIVRLYDQQMIESRIPPATDSAVRRFYQENRDSLFYQLAKVNIYAIIDSSRQALDTLKLKLSQNVPFEKLRGEVLVKTFIRDRSGVIRSYFSTEPPFLGEAAFRLSLSEVAGPIEYTDPRLGRQYALIKCVGKREEKQLEFQDVAKTIAGDFTAYERAKITKATEDQLRTKYAVRIDEGALRQDLLTLGIISHQQTGANSPR